MFQIKVEQGGITNIEPQKSSKAEPPELEENLLDDLPLIEDNFLNIEKTKIEKPPSPIPPEEPIFLKCTDCEENFPTVSELSTHKKGFRNILIQIFVR